MYVNGRLAAASCSMTAFRGLAEGREALDAELRR